MPAITPNLWFDAQAEDAAKFYVSVFPNSEIRNVSRYLEEGPRETGTVLAVDYVLDGHPFTAINGGPEFTFDEAISFAVNCKDQAEVDYYWEQLTADGGEESQCGWLKDKFGVSWQIIPEEMGEIMANPDPVKANRAMKAMFGMKKLDIAALRAAADEG